MDEDEQEIAAAKAEKDRRRRLAWVTAILFLGLPIYLLATSWIISLLTSPVLGPGGEVVGAQQAHWAVQLLVVLVLGLVWAFPLKRLVQGLGRR